MLVGGERELGLGQMEHAEALDPALQNGYA